MNSTVRYLVDQCRSAAPVAGSREGGRRAFRRDAMDLDSSSALHAHMVVRDGVGLVVSREMRATSRAEAVAGRVRSMLASRSSSFSSDYVRTPIL